MDFSDDQKAALVQARKDWERYSHSHCLLMTIASEGGSIRPMHIYSCQEKLARSYIEKLQRFKDGYGEPQ